MAEILVVDDMKGVQYAILSVLRRAGHDVTEADNGSAAIKICNEQTFDLVITDMLMPEGDGASVISHLQRAPKPPAILAISGGGVDVSADQALSSVNVKTLRKPFTRDQLIAVVDSLLGLADSKTAQSV